jgi:Glycosyl transferase family 2
MEILVVAGSLLWVVLLVVPWRPWSTRECLEPEIEQVERNLCDVTVLIPARNESAVIKRTLSALGNQSNGLQVILVDDQSSDETASLAVSTLGAGLLVLKGKSLPSGWTGKLWALEQGWRNTRTELILLLDADIELDPRMIGALKQKLISEKLDLISIMARLRMETFWEKLLAPSFIFFLSSFIPFLLVIIRVQLSEWQPAVVFLFARTRSGKQVLLLRSGTPLLMIVRLPPASRSPAAVPGPVLVFRCEAIAHIRTFQIFGKWLNGPRSPSCAIQSGFCSRRRS